MFEDHGVQVFRKYELQKSYSILLSCAYNQLSIFDLPLQRFEKNEAFVKHLEDAAFFRMNHSTRDRKHCFYATAHLSVRCNRSEATRRCCRNQLTEFLCLHHVIDIYERFQHSVLETPKYSDWRYRCCEHVKSNPESEQGNH